jgi:hypothetical protein
MNLASQLRIAIAVVICAAIAAPGALGAGEPKNDPPFVRQAGAERTPAAAATNHDPAGEPKNEWPFTRPVSTRTASVHAAGAGRVAGEPKNETPFIRGVSRTPVVVQTSQGFDWRDAGIGAAVATLGFASVALAALALRAGAGRRPRATGS